MRAAVRGEGAAAIEALAVENVIARLRAGGEDGIAVLDVGQRDHAVEQRGVRPSNAVVRPKSTNSAWMSCGGTAVPMRLSQAWVTAGFHNGSGGKTWAAASTFPLPRHGRGKVRAMRAARCTLTLPSPGQTRERESLRQYFAGIQNSLRIESPP